jgi:hypothetical protein
VVVVVEGDELEPLIEPLLPEPELELGDVLLEPEPPELPDAPDEEPLGELPMLVEPDEPDEPDEPAVLGLVLLPLLPLPIVVEPLPLVPEDALPDAAPGCAPPAALSLPPLPQAARDIAAATMTARAVPRESWEAFI